MSLDNSSNTAKDRRQLSITDFFSPSSKKRKCSSASKISKTDICNITNESERSNSLFDMTDTASNKPLQDGQVLECGEQGLPKPSYEDCPTVQAQSSELCHKMANGDTASHNNQEDVLKNLEASEGSQDLVAAILAERKERNKQFLKRDIMDDDGPSEITPTVNIHVKRDSTKKKDDDMFLIYNSPDLLADTFPTPDFDLDMDSQLTEVEKSKESFLGLPKTQLKIAPSCLTPLPKLQPTKQHTILFDTNYFDFGPPPPSNSTYVDAWDSVHVKLPCSPKNLFPIAEGSRLTKRWELIENALLNNISTAKELEVAIKSYNVRLNQPFRTLDDLINKVYTANERDVFFTETLPQMVKLTLSLPTLITQPVPLLTSQRNQYLTLSQQQCACLLANAFFCTFPRRNSTNPESEYRNYPSINFNRLLIGKASDDHGTHEVEKLKTLLHYFQRIVNEMPAGVVTFERRVCQDFPVWSKSPCKLGGLHVTSHGLIEDGGKGMLQLDFANKFIGGGVLSSGMVQEEILFTIFPELIVSRLFSEVLHDNECIYVIGAERFSNYSGYASQFKFEGNHIDSNTRDTWRRKASYIVALDATHFRRPNDQYKAGSVRRELNKLYCGFQEPFYPDCAPAIATGNWGCGAFRGNPLFKALLQMMSAAVVCRDLCYFSFGDDTIMEKIYDMHCFISSQDLGVSDLWQLICNYNEQKVLPLQGKNMLCDDDIFEFIKETICCYDASTDDEE